MEEEKKQGLSVRTKGLIAAIICYTIYGFSFIFSRIALSYTEPEVMLTIRFGVALLAMTILIPFKIIKIDYKGKPILPLIALGMCQPVLYFFCESYGIKYTNASFAGIMIAIIPVMSTILSAVVLKESVSAKKMLWISGTVVGAIIVTVAGSSSGSIKLIGLISILGAVILASLFSVLSRNYSKQFSSVEITYMMMVLGFLCFFIVVMFKEGGNAPAILASALTEKNVMLPILYLSILSSIVAFFLQNYSLAALPIQSGMVFANLIPVVTTIAGVTILGEPFGALHAIGMIVILVSIFMVNKES